MRTPSNYQACCIAIIVFIVLTVTASEAGAPLKIDYPANGARVSGKVIELRGSGADPKAQIEVSVLTNEWYVQNGRATINADGTWSYSPCYLSGQGQYNNHTVRVTLIANGNRTVSARVRGIVRRD